MRCIGVHIACMTSGGRLSKRIMAMRVCCVVEDLRVSEDEDGLGL